MDPRTAWQRRKRKLHAERMKVARDLRGGECERPDCTVSVGLEWDHIDPKTKDAKISQMDRATDEQFWAEVAKCQLLCRPHHIEKTTLNGEWSKVERAPLHGLVGYKHRKCRCDICRAAKSVENAKRRR